MSQTPFRKEFSDPQTFAAMPETEFEKPRGIYKVEIRRGFLTVHVSSLDPGDPTQAILSVLKLLRESKMSIDFLKLTKLGLSFVTPESLKSQVSQVLQQAGVEHEIKDGCSIVLAYAANMRDEEGLIARVVSEVIGTGVRVDHLGDMHDRVLMVMDDRDADKVKVRLEETLIES